MICDYECEGYCGLPDVEFSVCGPSVAPGEVTRIFLTRMGYPLNDLFDVTEWETRIGYPLTNPSRIIMFQVVGEKPEAKTIEVEGPFSRKFYSNKEHTVPFVISQLSDANYNAMRFFERVRFALAWFSTAGGKLYGGNCGNEVELYMNHLIPKDKVDIETIEGSLKFITRYHPERNDMPVLFSGGYPPLPPTWLWSDGKILSWKTSGKILLEET